MRVVFATAVAALCCATIAAASSRPGIVVGHRIGPVSIEEPMARVVKALGRGTPVQVEGNPARFYRKPGIYVLYPPNRTFPRRVLIVMTRSARYTTRSGIGIGSSLRQLRRAVKVTCFRASPHSTLCRHADAAAPTNFLLRKSTNRISTISIASTAPYR